ncbi:helix-turn-helix domain-containing protein [Candidatus Woesearchaeota archaeon]|nr:helix-turn-helix domain-containing protein [Candidatus Woesearchaeota archaeon]
MAAKTEEIEKDILDLFVRVNADFGNDSTMAKILSVIYLSPEDISLEEIMDKTGYSAATISNKTKTLVNHGLIKRVSKPGTKKSYYSMEKDMKKILSNSLEKIIDVKIRPIKENMPGLIEEYSQSISKNDEEARKKLEIMKDHLRNAEIIEKDLREFIKKMRSQ